MPRLTKTLVESLRQGEADYLVWDNLLSGFGIRVWPSGRKVYLIQYRSGRRQRRVKIGDHGILTAEEARKQARALLGDVARGADPQEERQTRRSSITVSELCDDYLTAAQRDLILGKGGRPKKGSTLATDRGRVERHIKPLLGRKLVIDLTRADIVSFVHDVTMGRTATVGRSGRPRGTLKVTGGAGTAARTKGLLGGILSFAIDRGIITNSPAAGVRTAADRRRERRLSADELSDLGRGLDAAAGEHWQNIVFAKLACLTGWRKSEIEGLRWDTLDLDHATARLTESKEGRSLRPLGAATVRLLRSIPRHSSFVLPPARGTGGHYNGGYRSFLRLCTRAGIEGVSPHTCRHTVVTLAQERLGIPEAVAGEVVGHRKSMSATAGYTHFAPPFLIAAASTIDGEIARLMGLDDLLAQPV